MQGCVILLLGREEQIQVLLLEIEGERSLLVPLNYTKNPNVLPGIPPYF